MSDSSFPGVVDLARDSLLVHFERPMKARCVGCMAAWPCKTFALAQGILEANRELLAKDYQLDLVVRQRLTTDDELPLLTPEQIEGSKTAQAEFVKRSKELGLEAQETGVDL